MPFVSTDQSTFYSDQNTYRFTVQENSPSGTVIGKIQFQRSGDGTVYYTLLGPDTDNISLGPDGTLTLRSVVELDFEAEGATKTLRIDISAIFFGSDGSVDYAETSGSTVTITDVNESPALFVTGEQSLELRESLDSLDNFVQSLILGPTWNMPREGPLTITWSMVTPWSADSTAARSAKAFGRREDTPVFTPSQSVIQQRIDFARNAILRALAEFEAATNVRFIEVGEDDHTTGDIRFLFGGQSASEGRSTGPGIAVRNSIYLEDGSIVSLSSRNTGINLFDYWVLVHEIGHTMGLSHPFHSTFGWPGGWDGGRLETPDSIMSYLERPHLIDGSLTDADIAALQFLYSRPGTNFDGVESRLSTPAPVMELRLSRHEIVLDENTVTLEMKLADFTIVRGIATANHPVFRVGDQSIFELRQEGGTWSLWLRGGQALDHEATTGYLALFGEASDSKPLLNPAYFRVKVRDIDEVPTAFTLAASEESRVEAIYPNGHKLTDINVTDDALGSYSLALAEDTPDIFELRGNRDDGWSLWIRDGAVVDFETLGSEVRAMIEITASGVGTTPPAREFTLTIENELESVNKINLVNLVSEWQHGVELQAGTKLADIVLTGRKQHVGKSDHWERITLSGEDSQFFTIVDGELRLARDLTPDISAKAGYSVRLRYNETVIHVDYELQVVEPAIQSAGSRGDVFQRPPDDVADDGLNDPLHDDPALPQMDVVETVPRALIWSTDPLPEGGSVHVSGRSAFP